MQQGMNVTVATREEYRLTWALARVATNGDPAALAAINKVALYQEWLWDVGDKHLASRAAKQDAPDTPPAKTPAESTPPNAA